VTTGGRPDIVVTGLGVACAVGTGCSALRDALATGRDGLRGIERFSVLAFGCRIAGLWPEWDGVRPEACTALELASASVREAWATARADEAGVAPARVGLVLGTCFGENCRGFSELARNVARVLGAEGPCLTVPTACAASTAAIGVARDLIEEGAADLVVAGGVDVITREIFAGFHALGALSAGKCAPFGATPGLSLGEGSGFVVVETLERARARALQPLAFLLGYGLSADAFHETAPDPSGGGVMRAVRAALDDASTLPADVDFVSAHGTGTEANDAAEWVAVRASIGDRVPVSSSKSFFGHAQGAAGVLELAALLLCMQEGLIPPTLRANPPRAGAPADPVAGERPRPHPVRRAVKISAAFGGANAALVVGQHRVTRARSESRSVAVTGLGAVGPHGLGVAELAADLAGGRRLEGPVPDFDLGKMIRSAPPRDLDPSGKYATAAAALALSDANTSVRGALRERSGIFLGNTRMSPRSVAECESSIRQRGITGVAAVPFSRMVLNAPAGTCAKLLSLKGPLLTVSAGRASGLLAIVRAAAHLASGRGADLIVAGGLDELPVEGGARMAEGAAVAVLAAEAADARVTLEGWGVAGPGDASAAMAQARARGGALDGVLALTPRPIDLTTIDLQPFVGGAEGSGSAFAFVLACALVRRGAAGRVLVVAVSDSIACAAVVSRGSDGR